MLIRPADSSDVPVICDLWQQMAELHSRLDPRFGLLSDDQETFLRYLRNGLRARDMRVLVADVGAPLGVAGFGIGLLREGPRSLDGRCTGHISDLAVHEGHRRQGLGTALYRQLEAWFRSKGVGQVTLNVSCRNPGARAFWASLGFEDFTHRLCLLLSQD